MYELSHERIREHRARENGEELPSASAQGRRRTWEVGNRVSGMGTKQGNQRGGGTKGSAESLDQDRHLQEPMVMQGLEGDDDCFERLMFIFLF
jgi:hypothetical protein